MARTHDSPSDVAAEDGDVHVEGPDGIAYSMTPEAAAETSDRLFHAANHAGGQRIEAARKEREHRDRR